MTNRITERDKHEFRAYLRACTDSQVKAVYFKEHQAKRRTYARLALEEELTRAKAELLTDPLVKIGTKY